MFKKLWKNIGKVKGKIHGSNFKEISKKNLRNFEKGEKI